MDRRIIGVETEFGCLVHDPKVGPPERVVEAVKNHAFDRKRWGLIDMHARNYAFEPARSGGFLINGGRLYVDAVGDHEEYATAECSDFVDLIAHDRAGRVILQRLLDDLGLADAVSFHNNSVDHFGGHTFGCHENYLVNLDRDFFNDALNYFLPFLVTRQIFAGVGRVGGHRLNHHDLRNNIMEIGSHEADWIWVSNVYGVEIDRTVDFQLSQRADHIIKTISGKVRFNRAIINPKWDSYYDFSTLHRLHVLYGESNMSEYATLLKVGTTSLVLDLLELGAVPPEVRIADPLATLRAVSRDPSLKWPVFRQDGSTIGAVDLQRQYLAAAREYLGGRDDQTDWVLEEWESTLDGLATDPLALSDRLDWAAKRSLLEQFIHAEGISWRDDALQSLDLEYHNINPEKGLYFALEEMGQMRRVLDDAAVETATREAPQNTRALGRSQIIKRLLSMQSTKYVIDWDSAFLDKSRHLALRNPFHTYSEEAAKLLKRF